MHRKNPVPRFAFGLILLGFAVGLLATAVKAADKADEARPADAAAPELVLAQAPEQAPAPKPQPPLPPAATPTASPVGNTVVIPMGASRTVSMKGNPIIKTVVNSRQDVATAVSPPNDLKTVVITGIQAGSTRLTLTGEDGRTEDLEVVVQVDIDYLRVLLTQAVPTASIQLIPMGTAGNMASLIISGNVSHAEDINIIMKVAESVMGRDKAVNAMRVGGVQQVQLDCVIAAVSRTELRNMNFDFVQNGGSHYFNSSPGGAVTTSSFTQQPGGPITFNNVFGSPNGQQTNFFLALFNSREQYFSFLQILRTEQLAKLLAEPRVVTMSGKMATFLSGGQQAVPSPGGLGAVSVQFVPFGTQLNVLPVVLGNGKIWLEVAPSVSQLDNSAGSVINGFTVAGRTQQQVHTTVEIEDGQTLVLGGLLQNQVSASTVKVPLLGDLPFVGAAFSSKSYREQETELLILVTPHLVDPMDCAQRPKVLPGQETRSPDDFELFLEGILEAPRGQRVVSPNRHYVPAYKNGPSARQYPCAPANAPNPKDGVGGAGCGMGLADVPAVGYPGVASANGKDGEKDKPAVAAEGGPKSDLSTPAKESDAAATAKPASLPAALTAGDAGKK